MVDTGRSASRRERFEGLYAEHYRALYAYAYRRLGWTGADVHDVVAEIFAVAWRHIDAVPSEPQDRLWLYGVARRCVARARRSTMRRWRLQERLSEEARIRASGHGSEQAGVIRSAVESLRPLDREVVQLVMWEGLSYAEAAQVLGCSENAVALRLHKARRRLRAWLIRNGVGVREGSMKPAEETP